MLFMNYKKTVKLYFIILLVQIIILLSFIGFYIILIEKTVNPGVVSFDGSQGSSCESINEEFAGLVGTPIGTEESLNKAPLLSLGKEEKEKENGYVGYKSISAYNAGDINQCSGDPCISASGDNICNLLLEGVNVCAANWVLFRTVIEIENVGKCIVLDRMPNANNVDWAMRKDEVDEAFEFGRRNLRVWVIN